MPFISQPPAGNVADVTVGTGSPNAGSLSVKVIGPPNGWIACQLRPNNVTPANPSWPFSTGQCNGDGVANFSFSTVACGYTKAGLEPFTISAWDNDGAGNWINRVHNHCHAHCSLPPVVMPPTPPGP